MPVIAHAISNYGRHQGLNGAQHRDGQRRAEQAMYQISTEMRDGDMRKSTGYSAETGAHGLNRQFENNDSDGSRHQGDNRARDANRD